MKSAAKITQPDLKKPEDASPNPLKVASTHGITIPRYFTRADTHPFDAVSWTVRSSVIKERDGRVVFEANDIEVPESWSQLATDILASKYLRKAGVPGKGRETSVRETVFRVAHAVRDHGEKKGYFASAEDAENFEMELIHLLLNQMAAFNSPVWFNCGLSQYGIQGSGGNWYWDEEAQSVRETTDAYSHPQCSACFIQSVDDDLMSIFNLARSEAKLFKYGSGTGTNFSRIRGKQEKLSGGGTSSGLMSFLEVLDKGAGATKSGGTTRRAAKMVCLDMDHPEIMGFITWKSREEKKAKALIDAGWEADFNGEAYHTVSGQNSNNSVRVSDDFMHAYLSGDKWKTTFRTTGELCDTYEAKDLMKQVAEATWACADPALQFDTTINDWHTCSNTDRIYASNPCSEFMFLDNTACNLASLNLMKFRTEKGDFNVEAFRHACQLLITAQEIIVDFASYPTKGIAERSYAFRPLGLGYANLGTLLMTTGIPYDSPKGRAIAGAITAIMCGQGYATSAEIARNKGPFAGYNENRQNMLRVMNKHRDAIYKIDARLCPSYLMQAAMEDWDQAVKLGEKYGYRNSQATVLAPTGTIGLLMDCDTTGVEPEFSLVKWKKLAGGGYFKIVNQSIPQSLRHLGYTTEQVQEICRYILGHATLKGAPHVNPESLKGRGLTDQQVTEAQEHIASAKSLDNWTPHVSPQKLAALGFTTEQIREAQIYVGGAQTIEGAPHIREEHLAVFDCANKCGFGERFIAPMGHVGMMAATQPFISGAISKTINLPKHITAEEIEKLYIESWKLGLKAIAFYRDGSKHSQPLNTSSADAVVDATENPLERGERRTLPQLRKGFTLESNISGHKLFLRTGEYEDGSLGEIFIDMYKEGAAYRSIINCLAIAVSIGLQYGVPLEKFVNSFTFTRFDPHGTTDHPNVRMCTSLLDFVFRVLGMNYLGRTDFVHLKPATVDELKNGAASPENPKAMKDTPPVALSIIDGASGANSQLAEMMGDAPPCDLCGHMTVRNGACYKCLNCGNSMGCS